MVGEKRGPLTRRKGGRAIDRLGTKRVIGRNSSRRCARPLPLALGDHAAMSQEISGAAVQQVARRSVNAHRYNRYAGGPRRYNWTYYPYWRPYQYRYWQFMYPYGGPMF